MTAQKSVWAIDFEYLQRDLSGELPEIRCCCLAELGTGETIKLWINELGAQPPIDLSNIILLAHNWAAEYSCFKKLGWSDPSYPIDTMIEADRLRIVSDVSYRPTGLKALLAVEGCPPILEKDEMRLLAMENRQSNQYSCEERRLLLDYCLQDTQALLMVWPGIMKRIVSYMANEEGAFFWAFQRARYVFCCTDMNLAGIPIDEELFNTLVMKQPAIMAGMHKRLKELYGCSDGVAHFSIIGLEGFIVKNRLRWPRTRTGRPKTDSDTLKRIRNEHPVMREFVEIFKTLKKSRVGNLNVTRGRCYSKIWPFAQSGSRNSIKKNGLFGAARWMRGLIKPPLGHGVAYLDYGREEILIQAVLANSPAYIEAYFSGDVHMANGRNFGLITDGMQPEDIKIARNLAKTAGFLIQYGGTAFGLSQSLGISNGEAEGIIRGYNRNYPEIGAWKKRVESAATALKYLSSPDGSILRFRENFSELTACNFPVQSTGAAILRWAQINLRSRGVKMLAPVHDAILVEFRTDQKDDTLQICKEEMVAAGKLFLSGHELPVDIEAAVDYPNSFLPGDPGIWQMIMELACTH
jgi:DNA polymerase-1